MSDRNTDINRSLASKWIRVAGVTYPWQKEKKTVKASYTPLTDKQLSRMKACAEYADCPPPGYLTSAEAARLLGMSRDFALSLFRRGYVKGSYFFLPGAKNHRILHVLLRRSSLDEFIRKHPEKIGLPRNEP